MSLTTYSAFETAVRALAFPEGEAEELVATHQAYIKEALINLQTYVPCLRDNNVDFYEKTDVQEWCNTDFTYINRGAVQAVYAFKPGRQCRRHFYDPKSAAFIDCWIEQQRCVTCSEPEDADISRTPWCNTLTPGDTACYEDYTQGEDESDCAFRNGPRYYAVGPTWKLHLAPRFPCGYMIAVHWEGIKREYAANDPLPGDEDLKNAVVKYVLGQTALFLDKDSNLYDRIMHPRNGEFTLMRADMIHRCTKERRVQMRRECMDGFDVLAPFTYDPLDEYNADILVGESEL